MAQAELPNRRQVLSMACAALLPSLAACREQTIGLALVFESPSNLIDLDLFEWPGMRNKRGMFGGGGMYLSPRSPAEMSFMAEETEGLPEWFDLSWQSPLIKPPTARSFEEQFSKAKRYRQRVEVRSQIPQSVVDSLRPGRVLKLRFTFRDAVVNFDYFVQQWK